MSNFFLRVSIFVVICFASSVSLVSCKSKSAVVDATKNENKKSLNKIIDSYYNNKTEFSTLYIKANAQFSTEKLNQKVSADIKIKKDEQILVSIRFLGITMAKALITPTKVSYYEKINGTYYDGDFSALAQLLGTDLDFSKVQNLLLGRAIDNLKQGKYSETLVDGTYRLDELSDSNTRKSFYVDENNFSIKKQEITQIKEERMIQASYSNQKEYKEMILPLKININSHQKNNRGEINLDYGSVNFNEELSFPYEVPGDYKRIIIK